MEGESIRIHRRRLSGVNRSVVGVLCISPQKGILGNNPVTGQRFGNAHELESPDVQQPRDQPLRPPKAPIGEAVTPSKPSDLADVEPMSRARCIDLPGDRARSFVLVSIEAPFEELKMRNGPRNNELGRPVGT